MPRPSQARRASGLGGSTFARASVASAGSASRARFARLRRLGLHRRSAIATFSAAFGFFDGDGFALPAGRFSAPLFVAGTFAAPPGAFAPFAPGSAFAVGRRGLCLGRGRALRSAALERIIAEHALGHQTFLRSAAAASRTWKRGSNPSASWARVPSATQPKWM